MTTFDGNTWWWITETRVNYTSALFWSSNSLHFSVNDTGDSGMYWQIYTLPNGNVQFRNKNSNTLKQLGTCYVADEVSSSKLQLCMEDSNAQNSQQWTISAWGDGTYKINNVANGTSLNADWHPGGPGFMSPNTNVTPIQPAQHWLFSSIGLVQDGLYSTSIEPTATGAGSSGTKTNTPASATAAATETGNGAASTSSSTSSASPVQQSSSSGLSGGAAAGIGIGVAAAVIGLVALAFFIIRRRKTKAKEIAVQELPDTGPGDIGAVGNAARGKTYEKFTCGIAF
ncbi:hypothetical protein, variant [Verruconis gallopava]|uniref:Ricin B lectin domain-containing protein n=1 Tax=Verruconis gallopava TaxID=253628 RepID=A0A0D1XZT4_9PEZI|nr:hypothetical protein, variant [Verruconis gallopava]KIW08321.1 hypothetical protein, variant [Verruconis gallopava]